MATSFDTVSQLHPAWSSNLASGQALHGTANKITSTFSLINAAEELSFNSALADKAEEKTLDERSLRKYEKPEVPSSLKVAALLQTMRDTQAAADMQGLSKRLIAAADSRNGNVLAMLKQVSGDPSKQYLLAAAALNLAQTGGAKQSTVELLRDAFGHLGNHHGPAIFAGINTVEQAAAFGPDQPGVDRFRNTYRDAVLGQLTFTATFMLLFERFGDDLERGVALLRQALAADLASLRPSHDPTRLHAILQDLCHLAATVSVLQRCRIITEQLKCTDQMKALQPLGLMQDLVAWVTEPWIMSYHLTQLIEKYLKNEEKQERNSAPDDAILKDDDEEESGEQAKCAFLNGILDILRNLPDRFFSAGEHRLQAVAAVHQVLDALLLTENDED